MVLFLRLFLFLDNLLLGDFLSTLSFILPHVIKININRKLKENKEDTQFTE